MSRKETDAGPSGAELDTAGTPETTTRGDALESDVGPSKPVPPAKLRRLAFRLDSGSLICCDRNGGGEPPDAAPVVLLSVDDAAEAGRTSHADVLRAQRHLEALYRAAAPRIAAAHEAALAAAAAGGAAPDPPAGLKRLRTDGDKGLDPDAAGTPIFSPGGTVLSGGEPPPPPDWLERCRAMHKTVMDFLGNALPIFDRPVDAAVVPDYYKVVKTPMDLGTILAKLNSAEYTRPSEFATDIRQVWYNCKLYNKKGDYVERTGTSAGLHFERLWAASGLAESKDRSRRSNAGLAAAKFEPPAAVASKRPRGGPTASSARSGGLGKSSSKAGRGGKKAGAGSKKGGATAMLMSHDQKVALAEKLGDLDEAALHGVVGIIRERTQLGGDDEEIELDIEALDSGTLWALDGYLKNLDGGAAPAADDSGSDSDSSTESDSDDE